MDELAVFLRLAHQRRATRRFKADPLPDGVLDQLLDAARWAPSGYNLQPTHFVVVTDPAVKRELCVACMDQRQIEQAPATVVFVGDRDVAQQHFELVLQTDRAAEAINDAYEQKLRRIVPLAFDRGPLGVHLTWKAGLLPLARPFKRIPRLPGVDRDYWLAKQAALCAMNFMLAATAAGLATCPMEGFAERAVSRVLRLPRRALPVLVMPVGYGDAPAARKTRLPTERLVHRERW